MLRRKVRYSAEDFASREMIVPSPIFGISRRKELVDKASRAELAYIARRIYRLPLKAQYSKPLLWGIVLYAIQERLRFLNTEQTITNKIKTNWQRLWGSVKVEESLGKGDDIWHPNSVENSLYAAKTGPYNESQIVKLVGIKRTPRLFR